MPAIRGSAAAKIGYATVYYPGTLQSSGATSVTLGISEERSGVDMQLQVVPLAQVSGSIIGPDGGLPPGGEVRLVESGSTLSTAKVFSGPVRAGRHVHDQRRAARPVHAHARTSPKNYQLHVVDHEGAMSVEGKVVLDNFEFSRNAL